MRTALRTKTKAPRDTVSNTKSYPAPVGGWNARDSLATMPLTDAVALDNWMPKSSYVELRGGSIEHTAEAVVLITTESGLSLTTEDGDGLSTEDTTPTLIVGNIKTLLVYNAVNGISNKFFAVTDSNIYDVTASGIPVDTGVVRSNAKHDQVMFGDGDTHWLIAPNGVDKPLYYDGTTWTAVDSGTSPALIGLDTTFIIGVAKHKGRLYFLEKNSLSLWYLPAGVAGGTLTEFDISADAKRGGFLMAVKGWTRDAGDGQDDVLVCVTSEGDALVYQGNNPSSAANWSLVGSFYVGKPLGRRCLTQTGGEIVILTENGAFPLSAALLTASVSNDKALSDKIVQAFTEAGRTYGDNFGWESTLYPAQQALIVNVPVSEDGLHYQYVMNTQTKAWARFTDWDAECFAVFNRELYFAQGTSVFKAWVGTSDTNDAIEWYGKQAFSEHGHTGNKRPNMFRPIFQVNGNVDYSTAIDVEFNDLVVNGSTVTAGVSQIIWGQGTWGVGVWGGGQSAVVQWGSSASHPGYWLSGKVKGSTNTARIKWMASNMVFETGTTL